MLLKSIARILVKYVGNAAGFGVAGDAIIDIWDLWGKSKHDQAQKLDEIKQLAGQSSAEAHQHAAEVVAQEAAGQPETVRQALTAYLSQLPNAIRQSQRRPKDPSGRTVSSQLRLTRPEDLLPLLPARLPRFKVGDRPAGVGDWELVELLGMGGFGEVWKAKNPYMPHAVALKFCLDPAAAARMLEHEAAVLGRVMGQGKLPGIVQLLHTYLHAEVPCLEYEFVGGGDLTNFAYRLLQQNHGKLPVQLATNLMRNIIRGVRSAHRLTPPIVHRDLKPANILVQPLPDGKTVELCIADFGIGGVASKCAIDQTRPGEARGPVMTTGTRGSCTPIYCSPQQARGEDPDPRDDVHALGVIWYQLLVGDLTIPVGPDWHYELADRQVPEAVVRLLGSCLADKADRRPADAGLLAEELKKLAAPPPPAPPPPPVGLPRRPETREVVPPPSPGAASHNPAPPVSAGPPQPTTVGKPEVASGDSAAARREQDAAKLTANPKVKAEAHFNAYQAALERQAWDEALAALRPAVALDPGRLAPFPFDRFEPKRILGAGGFGVVFLCEHRHLGRPVVIKSLQASELDRTVADVFGEARVLEDLNHPAIIRLRDCDYADAGRSRPYLVMDYFDGVNLNAYVADQGILSPEDLLAVAVPTAQALKAAHDRKILHRDVKPANLLVRRDGGGWQVKLIDFGLAMRPVMLQGKASTDSPRSHATAGKSIAGTRHYAAPEQMEQGGEVGPHSDVYGFGRTCYFALLSTPEPDDVEKESLPEPWRKFLSRCTGRKLANRLVDFAAVLAELEALKPAMAALKTQPPERVVEPQPPPAKKGGGRADDRDPSKPRLFIKAKGVVAEGQETANGLMVFAGSQAVKETAPSLQEFTLQLRNSLVRQGVLVAGPDCLTLTRDHPFDSPSTAAGIILGRSSNGRIDWKDKDGRTLKQLQKAEAEGGASDEAKAKGTVKKSSPEAAPEAPKTPEAKAERRGRNQLIRNALTSTPKTIRELLDDSKVQLPVFEATGGLQTGSVYVYLRKLVAKGEAVAVEKDGKAAWALPPAADPGMGKAGAAAAPGGERSRAGVSLADVIAAGVLAPPLKLFRKYKGRTVEAELRPDGQVAFQGVAYATSSEAGKAARCSVTGRPMTTNPKQRLPDTPGWYFWQYHNAAGKRQCLDDARQQFIKGEQGRQAPLVLEADAPADSVGLAASAEAAREHGRSDKPESMVWQDDPTNPVAASSWTKVLVLATRKALALGLPPDQLPMPHSPDGSDFRNPAEVRPALHIETHGSSVRIQSWVSAMLRSSGKERGFLRIATRSGAAVMLPSPLGEQAPLGEQTPHGTGTRVAPPPPAGVVGESLRFEGHEGAVNGVAFSPDGRLVLSGSGDKTVRLWDAATRRELHCLKGHTREVRCVAFSPDGRLAASAAYDHTVRLWDAQSGRQVNCFEECSHAVASMTFSANGRYVFAACKDWILRVWDVTTGEYLTTRDDDDPASSDESPQGGRVTSFEPALAAVWCVAASRDGRYVLAGCVNGPMILWDAHTGKQIRSLGGQSLRAWAVAFSADSRFALSGGGDKLVRLWDVETGQELAKCKGHTKSIWGVAFSPDGLRAVSGGHDDEVRVWDVRAGRELHCLKGHYSEVTSVAYAPDGCHVLSGSRDKTLRIWEIPN